MAAPEADSSLVSSQQVIKRRPEIQDWKQFLTWIAVACQVLCTVYLAVESPRPFGGDRRPMLPDRKEDAAFNERLISGPIGLVRSLIVLPNGKILASGKVRIPGSEEHVRLIRMNEDGKVDPTFHLSLVRESEMAREEPSIAAVLADQSILLAHSPKTSARVFVLARR